MLNFLVSSCVMITYVANFIESPQWLIAFLILQTLLISLLVSLLKNIWYSYVLFLVFLGGLLVIFTYVGGLTTKMKLEYYFSKGWVMGLIGVLIPVVAMSVLSIHSSSTIILFSSESLTFEGLGVNWSSLLYVYSVFYLLLTFYCVCHIVKSQEGPLRLLT